MRVGVAWLTVTFCALSVTFHAVNAVIAVGHTQITPTSKPLSDSSSALASDMGLVRTNPTLNYTNILG